MLSTKLSKLSEESVSHDPAIKKKVFIRKGEMGNIMQVALVNFLPGQIAPAHIHTDMYESFIVQKGKGQIQVDKEILQVEAGDCVLVSPGESHTVTNNGSEQMEVLIIGEEISKV